MYVKVVNGKEQYAKIAEHAIGPGVLDRFIVTNQADFNLVNKIRKDLGCGARECPLYRISPKSTKNRYDVPLPPPGVETVTSVLNVENAMAFNFLVDHASIDTSALGESKESSEKALLSSDNSIKGGKIRKVFFLPNGDYWEANRGNVMMVSNDKKAMKQTIGVDRSAAIESTKHEMKALQLELARNKEELKGVNEALLKHKKAWNVAKEKYSKTCTQIKSMESTLQQLRDEAETSEEAPTIDTTEYENDIQEAEVAVQDLKKKEAAVLREIDALQPTMGDLRRQLEEVDARNVKIGDEMDKVHAKLEDIVKGQTLRMEMVDKVRAKVEQIEDMVNQQEGVVKEIKSKAADALVGARKMQFTYNREVRMFQLKKENGGELPPDEEVELEPNDNDLDEIEVINPGNDSKFFKTKLQNKLKKIDQEKQRRNMSESDPAVARDKYFRARKDMDSKMQQIEAIAKSTKDLTKDLKDRKSRWRQFRGHIAQMTNLGFDEMLNKKGSAGEVEFDHDNKRLNLVVQKSNADTHSQTRDVKALSGGERSFATLSLLLAIGESLETPFRVMDEFDVFLDPVARKIAMENLVRVAKEMGHRQFIFITPQDVSNLKTDPQLRIFKMNPPKRNTTVGGAQQQTLNFDSQE
jgi:chromosome segregation ATPase